MTPRHVISNCPQDLILSNMLLLVRLVSFCHQGRETLACCWLGQEGVQVLPLVLPAITQIVAPAQIAAPLHRGVLRASPCGSPTLTIRVSSFTWSSVATFKFPPQQQTQPLGNHVQKTDKKFSKKRRKKKVA